MIRLAESLKKMEIFKNSAEIDEMVEEFQRAYHQQGRISSALSDLEESDDEQMHNGDPLDYFDDSDFEGNLERFLEEEKARSDS